VISTRDVVFNKETVFDGKKEDIMDNLMHSTLNEIAAWVRSAELPEPTHDQPETEAFFKDDTTQDTEPTQEHNSLGDHQGRKIGHTYPTPPVTPLPVALLAHLLAGVYKEDTKDSDASSKTVL
jgi:hypothetical protein